MLLYDHSSLEKGRGRGRGGKGRSLPVAKEKNTCITRLKETGFHKATIDTIRLTYRAHTKITLQL